MAIKHPPCPRCHDDTFVRVEYIATGTHVYNLYYCGQCESEWEVTQVKPFPQPKPDRRKPAL
jgi:transposase-like protein